MEQEQLPPLPGLVAMEKDVASPHNLMEQSVASPHTLMDQRVASLPPLMNQGVTSLSTLMEQGVSCQPSSISSRERVVMMSWDEEDRQHQVSCPSLHNTTCHKTTQ